jgi:hypothetical protein
MHDLGVKAEATFVADLRRCRHPQAEPVVLTTGELVACVCIGCYQQLPADYIERQATEAHVEAYCLHKDSVEVTRFGSRDRTYACRDCGSWVSNSTWPTLNPQPFA